MNHSRSRGTSGAASRWLMHAGLTCFMCTPLTLAQNPATSDYDELTNVYRPVTNFNIETVRGMALAPDGTFVFINTHGSTISMHRPGGPVGVPEDVYPTVNNPIAVGVWGGAVAGDDQVLVLGGTSHVLTFHDFDTGRIRGSVQLPAETGDLVIYGPTNMAFASCPGNNTVVQIDLENAEILATFTVASQRPRFLALDLMGPGTGDDVVRVTPELSGNNTVTSVTAGLIPLLTSPFNVFGPSLQLFAQPGLVAEHAASRFLGVDARVVDLDPFEPSLTTGLPDEDLFEMSPVARGSAPQTLAATGVLRGAGTILNAHGRNPFNGEYWVVGTDAINGHLLRQSEPSLKGDFAVNQLAIATTLNGAATPLPRPSSIVDLDDPSGAKNYSAATSIASPYALEFHPQNACVLIGGVGTDRIRFMSPAGARLGDLQLPPGSIPRDILFDTTGNLIFVYCWGTNQVRVFFTPFLLPAFAAAPNNVIVDAGLPIDLGVDPTPEPIARGRALFYDADNSAHGRSSCNTCHPGGGTDILGWVIKDFPHDHKDLMVTQSLKGIEDTFPYHWRGERDLAQFNGAFEGLLGGARLGDEPGGALDDFIAFVFSLQPHANPNQDPRRKLNAALVRPQATLSDYGGRALGANPTPVGGQEQLDVPDTLFESFSCADCHQKVTGSVGDINFDDLVSSGYVPTNGSMDVAHFRQLFHRTQDVVPIQVAGQTVDVVRGGYGITHDGNHPSSLDFIADPLNAFALNDNLANGPLVRAVDMAAFIQQADEGTSPAVHHAWYLDDQTLIPSVTELTDVLFDQVGLPFQANHGVSAVALGTHQDANGVSHDLRWYLDVFGGVFRANDPSVVFPDGAVGIQSLSSLVTEILAGRASMLVMGVPPGNAFRYAVDRDNDGLSEAEELAAPTNGSIALDPLNPDSDGDGWDDGFEYRNADDGSLTFVDPNAKSSDSTPPQLIGWRVDHLTATTAKIVYWLSEPATVKFTARKRNSTVVIEEERYVSSFFDTVTVQHLEPSLPELTVNTPNQTVFTTPLAGVPAEWDFEVTMTDVAKNTNTVPLTSPTPFQTKDQLVRQPFFLFDPAVGIAGWQRIIAQWTKDSTASTATTLVSDITVQARYRSPDLLATYANSSSQLNGATSPDEGQVVAAQVLFQDPSTEEWSVLQEADPSTPGVLGLVPGPSLVTQILLSPAADGPGLQPPFLLSTESNQQGVARFTVQLNNPLPSGAKLAISAFAIYERIQGSTGPINEFAQFSTISYQLPATAESLRQLVYE